MTGTIRCDDSDAYGAVSEFATVHHRSRPGPGGQSVALCVCVGGGGGGHNGATSVSETCVDSNLGIDRIHEFYPITLYLGR